MVELVDTQLNFLDIKSHSSLIIVAGASSLEGQRENTAILVSAKPSGGVKESEVRDGGVRRRSGKESTQRYLSLFVLLVHTLHTDHT
jgi:hypothetical protein